MAVTKTDLVLEIADSEGISQDAARAAIDGVLSLITKSVANGNDVQLSGFGSFKCKHRAARTARNPRTGENIDVPARNDVTFKPAMALRDALN